MASWRADWQAHATWWDQAHAARLWSCGTSGPAWSFGLHMRVRCTRWEGTSCDPCIVTRGSGAAFLFTPEAAGTAPAGAVSAGAVLTGAVWAGAASAGAASAGAASADASLVGSTTAGVAASAPASTAGSTSTAACVGWGWQKSAGFGRVMQQVVTVRREPFHPSVALGWAEGSNMAGEWWDAVGC